MESSTLRHRSSIDSWPRNDTSRIGSSQMKMKAASQSPPNAGMVQAPFRIWSLSVTCSGANE